MHRYVPRYYNDSSAHVVRSRALHAEMSLTKRGRIPFDAERKLHVVDRLIRKKDWIAAGVLLETMGF